MPCSTHASIRRLGAIAAACLALTLLTPLTARADDEPQKSDVSGTITDSTSGQPLQGAEVSVLRDQQVMSRVLADAFGHFVVHNLQPGKYLVRVRLLGFRPEERAITLADGANAVLLFQLSPAAITLEQIAVTLAVPIAIDTRSGNQVFQEDQYHGSPTSTTSQILQQAITGAARAPTGEVHIRGQHAEYTYYLDGIPVYPGISGSLNELFDPSIVDRISFITGGWDAEFGNRNAAIVNVQTRVPVGAFHLGASAYGGSYKSNGQSLNLSTSNGTWGFFAAATRQATDMRQYPVAFDTATFKPFNYSNHGQDLFGFGKIEYQPGVRDQFYLEGNASTTNFQIPFDSANGIIADNQKDKNSFLNLGWHHLTGAPNAGPDEPGGEIFTGAFYRAGSLLYTPGPDDEPSFFFFPDTTPYNLHEDRNFQSYGVTLNYSWRTGHMLAFKIGGLFSNTTGHESFTSVDSLGNPGPASNSDLNGSDADGYAQAVIAPKEWLDFHLGVRYDDHAAPFAGHQTQWSPRIRVNFYPTATSTFYLYYGRLFMPTNVEDLRTITSVADSGVATAPTLPERDDFYEIGYVQRLSFGGVLKLSGYYKESSPGIDDQTVPGSAIVTSVNLAVVHITGIEATFEIRPAGPWSGYINFALNHAYGKGPITGGFFPVDSTGVPGNWFDLDHDQRISSVASVVYSGKSWFASASGTYGTGLTNGADITAPIGTGIADFNRSIHVAPNFVTSLSAGYTWLFGKTVLRPVVYVDNLFNSQYLLKGQFFSGASAGRPRTVQVQLSVNL